MDSQNSGRIFSKIVLGLVAVGALALDSSSQLWAQHPYARVTSNLAGRVRAFEMQSAGLNEPPLYESGLIGGQFITGEDIVVGDFDDDGDQDYASTIGDRIRIFDGVPSSGVEQPFWESFDYFSGGGFGDMVVGDFNNDTIDDIAASAAGRLRIWYAPGQKAQGASEDWAGVDYTDTVLGLSAGDFDNDGNDEVAMPILGRVRIWEPATQPSSGGSEPGEYWASYDYGADMGNTVSGDFLDSDGIPEVAAYAGGRIRVWDPDTQPGGGNDSPEVWWSELFSELGAGNTVIGAGDYDGDGNDEIAGHYGFRIRNYEPQTQPTGAPHGWFSTDNYYPSPFVGFANADVDGDANLDFVTSVGERLRAWEPNDATPQDTWDFRDTSMNGEDASSLAGIPDNGATDLVWDGGSADWSTSTWNSSGPAPTASEDAFIASGSGDIVTVSGTEAAQSTLVISDSQLRIAGSLTGAVNVAGDNAVTTGGSISGDGSITGNLTNHGTQLVEGQETLDISGLLDLNGADLEVSSSYSQGGSSATFTLLTFGALLGAFDTQVNDALGFGFTLDNISYNANDILVTIGQASSDNADFDGNNIVNGIDFMIWQRNLGLGGQVDNSNGDANGDGVITSADLTIWETQYGTVIPLSATSTAVPEPASLLLLAIGCVAISSIRTKPTRRFGWMLARS